MSLSKCNEDKGSLVARSFERWSSSKAQLPPKPVGPQPPSSAPAAVNLRRIELNPGLPRQVTTEILSTVLQQNLLWLEEHFFISRSQRVVPVCCPSARPPAARLPCRLAVGTSHRVAPWPRQPSCLVRPMCLPRAPAHSGHLVGRAPPLEFKCPSGCAAQPGIICSSTHRSYDVSSF